MGWKLKINEKNKRKMKIVNSTQPFMIIKFTLTIEYTLFNGEPVGKKFDLFARYNWNMKYNEFNEVLIERWKFISFTANEKVEIFRIRLQTPLISLAIFAFVIAYFNDAL